MNITYTQNGDYLIPNIIIRKTKPLGHYGRLRKAYLEMHRPILFNELVLSDKLFEHCAEIEEAARNRMELIVRSLAEQNGVTEQLKAENQMEWVRQMNACKAQAEEVVKAELSLWYNRDIKIVKERIEGGANEKAVWRLFINCPFVCINFDFFWLNKARQLYMDF